MALFRSLVTYHNSSRCRIRCSYHSGAVPSTWTRLAGTRIRRMDTNRSAGSLAEVDETIERRITAEVEEHTNHPYHRISHLSIRLIHVIRVVPVPGQSRQDEPDRVWTRSTTAHELCGHPFGPGGERAMTTSRRLLDAPVRRTNTSLYLRTRVLSKLSPLTTEFLKLSPPHDRATP